MKRKIWTIISAGVLTLSLGMTSFAATWKQDAKGWWLDNGDGTFPAASWQWIDSGNDVQSCYYFDANGYLLTSTTTPDGSTVDANGAWTKDGQVQTRSAAEAVREASAASYATSTATAAADDEEEAKTAGTWETWTHVSIGEDFGEVNSAMILYTNPTTASATIAVIPAGATGVRLVSEYYNGLDEYTGWDSVSYNGVTGYVNLAGAR